MTSRKSHRELPPRRVEEPAGEIPASDILSDLGWTAHDDEAAPRELGLFVGGVTFLSLREEDFDEDVEEPAEWQRYVDDRLRHFTTYR